MFYFDWTYMLIIPGMLLGLWAQHKVKSTYAEYSRIPTRLGRGAAGVVDDLLRRNGNNKVHIGRVSGQLTDRSARPAAAVHAGSGQQTTSTRW